MAETAAMSMTQKIIAIAVTIIIISTVAIPVISDMESGLQTNKQNIGPLYNMAGSVNATINVTDSELYVNSYKIPADQAVSTIYPVFCEEFLIIWAYGNATFAVCSQSGIFFTDSAAIANGSISFEVEGTPYSISYNSDVVIAAKNGSYGLFDTGSKVYVNEDSIIYTVFDGVLKNADLDPDEVYCVSLLKGTYNDLTSIIHYAVPNNVTGSVVGVEEAGAIALTVNASSKTFSYTNDDGTYTASNATPIIAPIHYIGDNTGLINLIDIIPILLILVPVMLAVRMITLKRN